MVTPAWSRSSCSAPTVFWDEERKILIAALIACISSSPLISRPLDGLRPAALGSLVLYIGSMRKTREMPTEIVLSGYGEPITDHVALIDDRHRQARSSEGDDLRHSSLNMLRPTEFEELQQKESS